MKNIIIAIDGPAGSGKSTSARIVADRLGYTYLDTGAMYRAITLAVVESTLGLDDDTMTHLMKSIEIRVQQSPSGQRTFLNAKDVSSRIRESDITARVSEVSALPIVRQRLVEMQQQLGKNGGIVIDGRDIGTVVFPQAELKIFLVASIRTRAKRRLVETSDNDMLTLDDIALELERRDALDTSRQMSPLLKAPDAIEIDTSDLSITEQVDRIVELAQTRAHAKN